MTLTMQSFCPPADALTLLQFRSDAYQAWLAAPPNQEDGWLANLEFVQRLLEEAGGGPVNLDRR